MHEVHESRALILGFAQYEFVRTMGMNYYLCLEIGSNEGSCEYLRKHCIHLGKTSCGWRFLWNFHNNKYFDNLYLAGFLIKASLKERKTRSCRKEFPGISLTANGPRLSKVRLPSRQSMTSETPVSRSKSYLKRAPLSLA